MKQSSSVDESFVHECHIRDFYSARLVEHRPDEVLLETEAGYGTSSLRADLRTVDRKNVLREWEFKICADYRSLGQILTYVALARHESKFERNIMGVLAAFEFTEELRLTNRLLNLGIELVEIPNWMRRAGGIPGPASAAKLVTIPVNNCKADPKAAAG